MQHNTLPFAYTSSSPGETQADQFSTFLPIDVSAGTTVELYGQSDKLGTLSVENSTPAITLDRASFRTPLLAPIVDGIACKRGGDNHAGLYPDRNQLAVGARVPRTTRNTIEATTANTHTAASRPRAEQVSPVLPRMAIDAVRVTSETDREGSDKERSAEGRASQEAAEVEGGTVRGAGGSSGGKKPPADQGPAVPEPGPEEGGSWRALERNAAREADAFRLPENWEAGLPIVTGVAIDLEGSVTNDDIIKMPEYLPDGTIKVAIGISNVGFLAGYQAILARALAVRITTHGTNIPSIHMLPSKIREGPLSILEGKPTPIIAQDLLFTAQGIAASDPYLAQARPTLLTYDEVNRIVSYDASSPFQTLLKLADQIVVERRDRGGLDVHLRNYGYARGPEGRFVPTQGETTGSPANRIVGTFMPLFGNHLAAWTSQGSVPVLYRNYTHSGITSATFLQIMQEGSFTEQQAALKLARSPLGRPVLSTTPTGNDLYGIRAHLRGTGPLWDFEQLINIMNVHAALTGQPYPFPAAVLSGIIEHIEATDEQLRLARAERHARLQRP